MSAYHPDLAVEARQLAIDRGHQMVVDDLALHPTRSAEHYALAAASLGYSSLSPNGRKHLLVRLGESPTMAGRSDSIPADFVEHKRYLENLRDSVGIYRSVWRCGMQDTAIGVAQAADELFQADGDGRGYRGSSVREFVFQFVHPRPEHAYVVIGTPVARPADAPSQVGEQAVVSAPNDLSIEEMEPVAGATELSCPAILRPLNLRSR